MRAGFARRYGPWALVAGSVEGMGDAYARAFAERGLNLLLVDRDHPGLAQQAARLADDHPVEVREIRCDLGDLDRVAEVVAEVGELEVGMLVFNAAAAEAGGWLEVPLARKELVVRVNVLAPLLLVDPLSRAMAERRRGGIILTSSMAAFQGAPRQAMYAATKAFDLILGETLWAELKEFGVDALAFVPGMVDTPAFARSGADRAASVVLPPVTPEKAVEAALEALGREPSAVPGLGWQMAAFTMSKLMPRKLAIRLLGEQMKALGKD
jgi:short-subunit dehydrogenase